MHHYLDARHKEYREKMITLFGLVNPVQDFPVDKDCIDKYCLSIIRRDGLDVCSHGFIGGHVVVLCLLCLCFLKFHSFSCVWCFWAIIWQWVCSLWPVTTVRGGLKYSQNKQVNRLHPGERATKMSKSVMKNSNTARLNTRQPELDLVLVFTCWRGLKVRMKNLKWSWPVSTRQGLADSLGSLIKNSAYPF